MRRCSRGGARGVFYQYTAAAACKGALHLSCKRCGRLFHMDAAAADRLVDAVARLEDFAMDRSDTVLYGVCGDCRR